MVQPKLCSCGGKPEIRVWSASPTAYVICMECGKYSGDITRNLESWVAVAAVRAWNQLIETGNKDIA